MGRARKVWSLVGIGCIALCGCWATHTRGEDAGRDAAPSPDAFCTGTAPELRTCQSVDVAAGERMTIQLVGVCEACDLAGSCEITMRGTEVLVRATRTSCPRPCATECVQTCLTPPLEIGGYLTIVEGRERAQSFRVSDRAETAGETCW
jgi:hypothetical protein